MQKKQTEGADKAKQLQANQQKLQTSGSVMSEAARAQLEKEIERQQREGERFQQDAQAEINELQQELQNEFQKKLLPILEQIATRRACRSCSARRMPASSWADPGLDLTADVIKKLDATRQAGGDDAEASTPLAAASDSGLQGLGGCRPAECRACLNPCSPSVPSIPDVQ